MEIVKFFIEDKTGHTTLDVPKEKVQAKVEEQLKGDKLVTLEKKGDKTEILTKSDIPSEEEQEDNKKWAKTFKETKSATVHKKAKGF